MQECSLTIFMPASPLEPYHFSNLAPAAHRSGRSIWSSLSIYTTMKAAAYKLFYPLMAHDRCVLKRDNALNDVVGCPALAFVACSTHIKMILRHLHLPTHRLLLAFILAVWMSTVLLEEHLVLLTFSVKHKEV